MRAEQRGDLWALSSLLVDDFVGVGVDGGLCDKRRWMERYRAGDLVHHGYAWQPAAARIHRRSAVVVGTVHAASSYLGRDASGRQVVSLILRLDRQAWRVAPVHVHLSSDLPSAGQKVD